MTLREIVACLGPCALGACSLVPGTSAPATPQRPTLSSDTNTTPHGLVELELGVARDDGVSLDSPLTLKLGSGPRTELALGWSPFLRRRDTGGAEEGPGDVVVGLRHRLADGAPTSYALQALVKVPTARDPELGTGEVDAQLAAIASRSFGDLSGTLYYAAGVVGDPAGGSAPSHSGALALSHPVADTVAAFGEVAGVLVPEQDAETVFTTLGFAWTRDPSLVFDVGVVLGLSDEAADWQVLVGLTRNFGRPARR